MKKFLSILILVSVSSICALAQEQNQDDYTFTTVKELPITLIQNQNRTSTCWCFASLSFLESELIRMGKGSYNFSEMYVVWYTWLAKADRYVRTDGNINFAPGGGFEDFLYVIKNWGLVPEEVMPGLNYGEEVHVHNEMDAVLKGYVDAVLQNPNGKLSTAWKRGFEGILDAYLGSRPQKFTWQGKEYTPKSFAASTNVNTDDYVCLTSFTHHPFYTQFALEISDNWLWSKSYNLPLDEFVSIVDHAIDNGYTVLWASDASEVGFTRKGVAVVPDAAETVRAELVKIAEKPCNEKTINQEMRQIAFDNKQTTDDHAMHIFGVAKDQNGKKFYMVKNSYGTSSGYNGIWYASQAYVSYKTTNIMVHKNAIPSAIRQKLNIK
ncbi:MAG: aminopeptidase [Bacteroidales bacterium]|nr:aminopeptidase [Bacteroidales bacterium]